MIVYEVNLEVEGSIAEEYLRWLRPHTEQLLKFKGFQSAEICEELSIGSSGKALASGPKPASTMRHFQARYTIDTIENLNDYLANHAPAMRQEATTLFGEKFKAWRRVFKKT